MFVFLCLEASQPSGTTLPPWPRVLFASEAGLDGSRMVRLF